MVHASLKAIGEVEGGPAAIVEAVRDSVGPAGTVMAFVSWDRSPYSETLGENRLSAEERDLWPAYDPGDAGSYRGFGVLNQFIVAHPQAHRSRHPDASMVAIGLHAEFLVADHRLGQAYGPGSPLERFLAVDGKVLLLGASLDAVTVLHYAEAIAEISNKRRVSYEMPLLDEQGRKRWHRCEDFDSNGILDCFAREGEPDAVETIARAYVAARRHRSGRVGSASSYLFDAPDIVAFGKCWLETRYG